MFFNFITYLLNHFPSCLCYITKKHLAQELVIEKCPSFIKRNLLFRPQILFPIKILASHWQLSILDDLIRENIFSFKIIRERTNKSYCCPNNLFKAEHEWLALDLIG